MTILIHLSQRIVLVALAMLLAFLLIGCGALARASTIGCALPRPSWIGPGHWKITAIRSPSSVTLP